MPLTLSVTDCPRYPQMPLTFRRPLWGHFYSNSRNSFDFLWPRASFEYSSKEQILSVQRFLGDSFEPRSSVATPPLLDSESIEHLQKVPKVPNLHFKTIHLNFVINSIENPKINCLFTQSLGQFCIQNCPSSS